MVCDVTTIGLIRQRQAADLPATGFIPVVLGILHYSIIEAHTRE